MTWLRRWRFPWYDAVESDKLLDQTLAKIRIAAKDAGDGDATATLSLIDREGIEWVVQEVRRLRIAERRQENHEARLRDAAKLIANETGERRFRKAVAKLGLLVPESGVVDRYPEYLLELYGTLIKSDQQFLVSDSTGLILEDPEATVPAQGPMEPLEAVRFLAETYGVSKPACLQKLYRQRDTLKTYDHPDDHVLALLELRLPQKRDLE